MAKNTRDETLTAQARKLNELIGRYRQPLKHQQAMDIVAQLLGDTCLHAAQAKTAATASTAAAPTNPRPSTLLRFQNPASYDQIDYAVDTAHFETDAIFKMPMAALLPSFRTRWLDILDDARRIVSNLSAPALPWQVRDILRMAPSPLAAMRTIAAEGGDRRIAEAYLRLDEATRKQLESRSSVRGHIEPGRDMAEQLDILERQHALDGLTFLANARITYGDGLPVTVRRPMPQLGSWLIDGRDLETTSIDDVLDGPVFEGEAQLQGYSPPREDDCERGYDFAMHDLDQVSDAIGESATAFMRRIHRNPSVRRLYVMAAIEDAEHERGSTWTGWTKTSARDGVQGFYLDFD